VTEVEEAAADMFEDDFMLFFLVSKTDDDSVGVKS
jgi:hypothetical protein